MSSADSSLVTYTNWSPNYTGYRSHDIDTISIHCMAGNATIETCGALFAKPSRKASSQYGIGSDGRIGQYVPEKYRSWCTGNKANDMRAITIEVANNGGAPDWPVSDKAMEALINLLVDICKRHPKIGRLRWQGDKSLIGQVSRQNMTVHRWFQNKACPGNYLYNRHAQIAAEVNRRLDERTPTVDVSYTARVTAHDGLNCRTAPISGSVVLTYPYDTLLTITKEQGGWGYTGAGWVSLAYTTKEDNEDMDINKFLEEITDEQAYTLVQKAHIHAAMLPEPDWSKEEGHWQRATSKGIVNGEDPEGPMKRDETIAVLGRLGLV